MNREKVLITLPSDVLALVDERAKWHRMSRSAYITMRALGILETPDEEAQERRTDAAVCKICGQFKGGSLHDPPHGHNFVSDRVCAACGMSETMHANGQGGHPFEAFKE